MELTAVMFMVLVAGVLVGAVALAAGEWLRRCVAEGQGAATCPTCGGTGDCPRCEGWGCPECDGFETGRCPTCHGSGEGGERGSVGCD